MKLTFTCPECDTLIQDSDIAMTEYSGHWGFHDLLTCPKCPKCASAKLTYGPLTEEMMAEALQVARDCAQGCGLMELVAGPKAQARFVIQLLRALGAKGRITDDGLGFQSLPWDFRKSEPGTTWRDWLLDLARQK